MGASGVIVWLDLRFCPGQQEAFEAFDEFIAPRQMRPAFLQIAEFRADDGIGRLLCAPPAIGSAVVGSHYTLGEFLKHQAPLF